MEQSSCLDTYTKDIASALEEIEKTDEVCIVSSKHQTKDWRTNQKWYTGGKSNECEIYQRNIIEAITNYPCKKSQVRINTETLDMKTFTKPLKDVDGFEWTENFDGYQDKPFKLYYNLKMICASGGAQTRTLREVYHFIRAQLEYLLRIKNNKVFFVNILDGDESFRHNNKFSYLQQKNKYNMVTKSVFVGDLHEFRYWYRDLLKDNLQSDTPSQK